MGVEETKRTYTVRTSRLTVDMLGVRLYDKVSAVLSELVANSYDADAKVGAPMGKFLVMRWDGCDQDQGYVIEVEDDGIERAAGTTGDPPLRR